jgi:GntR family transcriptional regulator
MRTTELTDMDGIPNGVPAEPAEYDRPYSDGTGIRLMAPQVDWASRVRLEPDSFLPLYHQLKERLRAVAGELEPGTLMPSEKQLMEHATVSRATARKAVSDLVQEGVLYSQQGKGTFVARPRVASSLERPVGFSETMLRLGRVPRTEVLSSSELPASSEVASRLGLAEAAPIFLVERLRYLDDEPCMVERIHVSARLVPGLLERDLGHSFYAILREGWGLAPADGVETIIAMNAEREMARLLGVPIATALLATARTTKTVQGTPLEYTLRHVRGDYCAFTVALNSESALEDASAADPLLIGR